MATTIRDVGQINVKTSLSAYDVQGGNLEKKSILGRMVRSVSDFFDGLTTEGRVRINARNAQVASKINSLYVRLGTEVRGPGILRNSHAVEPFDDATEGPKLLQSTLKGIGALKAQIKDIQQPEVKTAYAKILTALEDATKPLTDYDDILKQATKYQALAAFIGSPRDMGGFGDDFSTHISDTFVGLMIHEKEVIPREFAISTTLNESCYMQVGQVQIPGGGIDFIRNNATLHPRAFEHATKIYNDFISHSTAFRDTVPVGVSESPAVTAQKNYYEELFKDALGPQYETYGKFMMHILDQDNLKSYVDGQMQEKWGFGAKSLRKAGIETNFTTTSARVNFSQDKLRVEINSSVHYTDMIDGNPLHAENFRVVMNVENHQTPEPNVIRMGDFVNESAFLPTFEVSMFAKL